MVAAVLAALSLGQIKYYTPSMAVDLELAEDVLAVEVVDPAATAAVANKLGAESQRMFGDYWVLTGVANERALRRALERAEASRRFLAAYRSPHEVLIADGRVNARFREGLALAEIEARVKRAGGVRVEAKRPWDGLYDVYAGHADDTVAVAMALQESRDALWAHPDFITRRVRRAAPNDPLFEDQWHHGIIGSAAGWDLETGSEDIILAIIDSGVDMEHPDLKGKLVFPQDTLNQDADPTPDQYDAHGTGCAGLAAASFNNDEGVAGVCPGCSIMPIQIMSETDYGRYGADVDAFYWAADNGAAALSNSWGPAGASPVPSNLANAIQYAADEGRGGKGALILFASGNDYRENYAHELASHPLVIGVGATSYWDLREDYSNWGNELVLTAPAGSVTTDMLSNTGYAFGDYMTGFGGTSAATPVAAGLVGLILSVDPGLTRGQVTGVMTDNADEIGTIDYTNGFNIYYGHGRINVLRALQAATGGIVCQPAVEDCSNGMDDDCDGLVDLNDTSCAPANTEVGAGCTQDFQCGSAGFCLPAYQGFEEGYCTEECNAACADTDAICVPTQWGSGICMVGCTTRDDCRELYDCMPTSAGSACMPSCTVSGCDPGEMCNTQSGECYHDGPVLPGGACSSSIECANDNRCLSGGFWGVPGGFCRQRCTSNSECPASADTCEPFGRWSMCVESCLRPSDCSRDGFTCHPSDTGTGGVCWVACERDDDCDNGEQCNNFGLCGQTLPPQFDPVERGPEVCTCDVTFGCDDDCDCDPECADGGCSALPNTPAATSGAWALLFLFVGLARRRWSE